MSPERASATAGTILGWIGPRLKKNRHVIANLRMAFPEKSRDELDAIARGMWRNVGSVAADFVHLEALTQPAAANPRVELVCHHDDPDFFNDDKPSLFVTAHLANWELAAYAGRQFCDRADVIYNPQKNPWLEKFVQDKRKPLGVGFIKKQNALRSMLRNIRSGRSVGLLVDLRMDEGPMLPFFGIDATVTTIPAWISLKTGCDIVPVQIERQGDARYRATIHQPIRTSVGDETPDEAVLRVTGEINQMIEGWIRQHPDQWLCSIRRWPKEVMRERGAYDP